MMKMKMKMKSNKLKFTGFIIWDYLAARELGFPSCLSLGDFALPFFDVALHLPLLHHSVLDVRIECFLQLLHELVDYGFDSQRHVSVSEQKTKLLWARFSNPKLELQAFSAHLPRPWSMIWDLRFNNEETSFFQVRAFPATQREREEKMMRACLCNCKAFGFWLWKE